MRRNHLTGLTDNAATDGSETGSDRLYRVMVIPDQAPCGDSATSEKDGLPEFRMSG